MLQIDVSLFWLSVDDLAEAAAATMAAVAVMTLTELVPVGNVDVAIWTILDREATK